MHVSNPAKKVVLLNQVGLGWRMSPLAPTRAELPLQTPLVGQLWVICLALAALLVGRLSALCLSPLTIVECILWRDYHNVHVLLAVEQWKCLCGVWGSFISGPLDTCVTWNDSHGMQLMIKEPPWNECKCAEMFWAVLNDFLSVHLLHITHSILHVTLGSHDLMPFTHSSVVCWADLV